MSISLPKNSGETVTGLVSDLFAPYCKPQPGDYLAYNPYTDKLVIMTIRDKPEYAVKSVDYKAVFKSKSTITIEKM